MLETMAAIFRALACDARLVILHLLSGGRELASHEVAVAGGMLPADASRHLARLAGVGLLRPRRSGRYVYYRFPPSSSDALVGEVVQIVLHACTDPDWATEGWEERRLAHVAADVTARLSPRAARALDVVFDAATAFGNIRRLQIVRLLLQRGACSHRTIARELSMSMRASARHVDKLRRRGYVQQDASGLWKLTERRRTVVHGQLLGVVAPRLA